MKYHFTLPDFPHSTFEMETSVWTGRSTLVMDTLQVEQSKESGRPFLIPTANGEYVKAYPKQSFPDLVPVLEIEGVKHQIVAKLKWFQYAIGGLPILLLFIGGAIGGAIGALASVINFSIFRQEGTEISKYIKVVGMVIASYVLYFVITVFLLTLLH